MMVMLPAVHMAVGDFVVGGGSYRDDFDLKDQRFAGQRMIAVYRHFFAVDAGDGNNAGTVANVGMELHADF